jgi:hypothetical protein
MLYYGDSHVWVGVVRKELKLEHPDKKRIGRDRIPRLPPPNLRDEEKRLPGLYGKVWKHYQAVTWELGDFDPDRIAPSEKTNVRELLIFWKRNVEQIIAKLQ